MDLITPHAQTAASLQGLVLTLPSAPTSQQADTLQLTVNGGTTALGEQPGAPDSRIYVTDPSVSNPMTLTLLGPVPAASSGAVWPALLVIGNTSLATHQVWFSRRNSGSWIFDSQGTTLSSIRSTALKAKVGGILNPSKPANHHPTLIRVTVPSFFADTFANTFKAQVNGTECALSQQTVPEVSVPADKTNGVFFSRMKNPFCDGFPGTGIPTRSL